MFKDLKIKNILPTIIIVAVFMFIVWFIFVKQGKNKPVLESSFDPKSPEPNTYNSEEEDPNNPNNLPGFFQLQSKISSGGKKSVFPMIIEKITNGPIELPNRRSLLNKDAKYKFIDIMPGQKVKAVSLQNLTYTVDHNVFNDNFLVTDNDYLIAYSQAKEHFKLAK
jgi:hypothetical protein